DEIEQLAQQLAGVDLGFAPEIDQPAVKSVAGSAPAVFIDQAPAIDAEGSILIEQLVQLCHDRLDDSGQRHGVVDPGLGVANPDLERVEKWMKPNVPPDFLRVIDTTRLDQQFEKIFILGKALEGVRRAGARET